MRYPASPPASIEPTDTAHIYRYPLKYTHMTVDLFTASPCPPGQPGHVVSPLIGLGAYEATQMLHAIRTSPLLDVRELIIQTHSTAAAYEGVAPSRTG